LFGMSMNELLTYNVPLQAVIKDWRLGAMNYLLMLLIVLYILGYQIWYQCGYLHKPAIGVSIMTALEMPEVPVAHSSLPYCSDICSTHVKACSCRDYHAEEVLHQGDSSITIVTSTDFLTKDNIITMREYVANVENYSLLIEPTIYQVNKKPTGRNLVLPGDEIQGRLFVGRLGAESTREQQELCQEKALQPDGAWAHPEGQPTNAAPCYVLADTQVNGNDVFKVSTLLRSMGKSLDSMEGKDWKKNITRNLRDSGLSVLLSLRVHSYQPGKGLIKPYYVLDLQAEGDSRQYFSIWSVDTKANGQREYRHEHGFRMEIAASGTFANYSTADLLDNFTNGMALLAFSAIAVKFIAIYFCPLGQVYKRAMTRDTPEGQDLEKLMDADFEEVKSKHQELYSHQTGTKEEMVLRMAHHVHDSESSTD